MAGQSAYDLLQSELAAAPAAPPAPPVDVYDIPGAPSPGPLGPGTEGGPDPQQQAAEANLRNLMLRGVDQTTGAPWHVRAAVNLAPDDPSRLATLRGFAPDAEALPGTDNFVYTDPASGRRTLYRPGFGLKDLTTVAATMPSLLGGIAGGALGEFGGGPLGGAAGFGLGSTAGSELGTRLGVDLLGTRDVRAPAQEAVQDVAQTAVNTALPMVGGPLVKGAISLLSPAASPIAAAADAVEHVAPGLSDALPLGVATGSRGLQRIDSALAQSAGGAGAVAQRYAATRAAIEQGVGNVANNAASGAAATPENFGGVVNGIATRLGQQWETGRAALDDAVSNEVGADTPTDIGPLRALRATLAAKLSAAPSTLAEQYQPALDRLDGLIRDAAASSGPSGSMTLPFSAVQQARTNIGKVVGWRGPGAISPTATPELQQVYGALNDTIQNQVNASGQPAINAYNDYMNAVRNYRAPGGAGEAVEALQNPAVGPNALVNWAKSKVPAQQAQLSRFINEASPTEQGQLAGGIINQLGINPTSGSFDVSRFARDWGALQPGAKSVLFQGPQAPLAIDLDNLATVASGMKDALGSAGHSNTGAILQVLHTLGGAGTALIAGEPGAAAATLGAGLAGPYALARAMQSRPFVQWLSGTLADKSGDAWGRAISRLGAVGEADPSVRDLATQLQTRLAASPVQQ